MPAMSFEQKTALLPTTGTVLVAEDEPSLRTLIVHGLEARGWSTMTAGDGIEALKACRVYAGRLDLVLTDVMMPGMTGLDLARILRAEHRRIPILLMTAFPDCVALPEDRLPAGVSIVYKPLQPDFLSRRIAELLAEGWK